MAGPARSEAATTPVGTGALVAVVVGHPVVVAGLREIFTAADGLVLRGAFDTVEALVTAYAPERPADVVLLDLLLADGSTPTANIERLRQTGTRVVAFTAGESAYLVRLAREAGAHAIVPKSADASHLVAALTAVARGEAAPPWPEPGDGAAVHLSARERETLALYAAGEKSDRVAELLGISVETVNDYISRVRVKYRRAGREAGTKVDLYKRAVEDGVLPAPGLPLR